MSDAPIPWTVVERREAYRNPWTVLYEDHLRGPTGQAGLYGWLASVDFIVVCPIHADGSVSLVRQWRHPNACWSIEVVCGRCEAGEAPAAAAARELAEECSLQAAEWTALPPFQASDARCAGLGHPFIARGLSELANPPARDASEADLSQLRVPAPEALAMARDGRIANIASRWLLLSALTEAK